MTLCDTQMISIEQNDPTESKDADERVGTECTGFAELVEGSAPANACAKSVIQSLRPVSGAQR